MGYNIKTAFYDLVELEKRGTGTISGFFGSETLEHQLAEGGQSIVDLKLGSLGDFGRSNLANSSKLQTGSHMERSLSSVGSSLKRGRMASNGAHIVVSCLVDGCKSDLSKCRDYHRRHKVCEMHSKAPRVTIGGNEQRFCQQCSRFHSLGEFDEGKRSCRKRLEGHNRRRRKPQPETLAVNHANFLSASPGGGKFFQLSNQPTIPSSSMMWSSAPKAESNPAIFTSSPITGSYCEPYRGRKFPFLQGPDSPITAGSLILGHHDPNPSPGGSVNSINTGQKMLCNDVNQQQVISSDRALSLLSSSPEMGLGLMNRAQSTMDGLGLEYTSGHFAGHSQGLEGGQSGGSAFMSGMRSSNSLFQDVFHSGTSSGSSASGGGGHPTLSFSWE